MAADPANGARLPSLSTKVPSSQSSVPPEKARGANRSTKVAGKLQVLPEQPDVTTQPQLRADLPPSKPKLVEIEPGAAAPTESDEEEVDEEEEVEEEQDAEVYNQIAQIPEGTARRDALRLTKKKAKSLPRVTAYATAASYRFDELMKFFNARKSAYHTNPRRIDEVIYTTYSYRSSSLQSQSQLHNKFISSPNEGPGYRGEDGYARTGDLLGAPELMRPQDETERTAEQGATSNDTISKGRKRSKFDADGGSDAEVFVFEYGTVVIWGMSEVEEKRFLSSLRRFEIERLNGVEMEDLNFYYANYSRIFNDVITLRKGSGFMTKLALSHALAQSVKISVFEELISSTIENTKDIPEIISETGKVGLPHKVIMQQIGELFLLRMNINMVGSVLDSPEVFWRYPDLQPLYEAAQSYLEIPQRVNLLNTRVEVLQDMLQLLKESVSSRNSERLEQIVIALIGVEIVLGIITILVDLYS